MSLLSLFLDGAYSDLVVLAFIATQPEYRGLGAGTMLVRWGLEEAEKRGLDCWLQASPFAVDFYRHLGFEDVSSFESDLDKLAGTDNRELGMYRNILMRRKSGK